MADFAEKKSNDLLPRFDDLPQVPGLPKGCAWGLWGNSDSRDELGTLNLLTATTIRRAAAEVREGITVSLKFWPLNKPSVPVFNRQKLLHSIIDNSSFSASQSFDDALSFNTQSGSQWDGLRHAIHIDSGKLYNGVNKDEIKGQDATNVLGIDKWHEKGAIVGRGVLIDYVAFAKRHNIDYSPIKCHRISHKEIELAALEQGLTFKQGDILLIRTGLINWYNECSSTFERDAFFTDPGKEGAGVDPAPETVAWLWNQHFSAVAGDALAWESIPYPRDRLLSAGLMGLSDRRTVGFGASCSNMRQIEEIFILLNKLPLKYPRRRCFSSQCDRNLLALAQHLKLGKMKTQGCQEQVARF